MTCRKRKLAFALLGLVAITPFLAFGISNIFLFSSKGRSLVAGKIEKILSLDASVQGASWSPWNGITVYGLRLEQPGALRKAVAKPLFTAESVSIHPDWIALCKKRLELRGIEVVRPEFTLPIELLSQIPHQETAPALAANPPDLASANQTTGLASPTLSPAPLPSPAPPGAVITIPQEKQPQAAPKSSAVQTSPTVWLNIHEGRLGIVSLNSPSPIFQASGINGGVPLAGKPAESGITVGSVMGPDKKDSGKATLPLKWETPALTLQAIGGEIFGLDFKVEGKIALVPGIPFRINALVPEQKDREIRVGGIARAKIGLVGAQGYAQGFLQAPATWQGQWIAKSLAVDAEVGEQKNLFDQGQALVIFQNGVLRCIDARLVSEQASIIGNAMLLSDGRMAGNLRLVAAPESLIAISRFTSPGSTEVHLTPLSTPQRAALDMRIFGRPDKLFYQSDPIAAPVLLR